METNSITPTRVLIAIPSKGRAERLKTTEWLQFSRRYQEDVGVFVEPQEVDNYAEGGVLPIISLPDNDRGLGYAKARIQEFAKENGYDYIFKMDDDIMGFVGLGSKPDKPQLAKQFDEMVDDCLETLDKSEDVVAIGFSYRWELYKVKHWISLNSRLQTAFICKTDYFYGDERVSVFEDFYTYLRIRVDNKSTLRYGLMGIDCEDVGVNPGGHQMFNREEASLKDAEYLREFYPALEFKRVKNKSWSIEPKLGGPFFNVKQLP